MGEDEGVEQKGRGTQARARLKEATGSPIQRLAPSASPSSQPRDETPFGRFSRTRSTPKVFSSHAGGASAKGTVSYQDIRRICRGFSVNQWMGDGRVECDNSELEDRGMVAPGDPCSQKSRTSGCSSLYTHMEHSTASAVILCSHP